MAVPPPPGYGGSGSSSGGRSGGSGGVPKPPGYSPTATTRAPTGGNGKVTVKLNGKTRTVTRGQATSAAKKAKKVSGGGGGIGGLLSQAGDLISSIPSGLVGTAKAVGEEFTVKPAENVYQGITEGDPGKLAQGIPGVGPGIAVGEGLAGGATGTATEGDHPFTAPAGASFRRTYEDVLHPTHFSRAYGQGTLLGKLVEDAANVSVVAGAAGSVLNTASRGAFADAATARETAAAAERAVPGLEKEAATAAKQASEHAAVVDQVKAAAEKAGAANRVTLARQYDQAAAIARDSAEAAARAQTALETGQAAAEHARTVADGLHAAAGPAYGAYRTAQTVARLGGQGANLPMKPLELAGKGFSAATRSFLSSNSSLRAALSAFDERVGVADAIRRVPVVRQVAPKAAALGAKVGEKVANAKQNRGLSARVRTIEGQAADETIHLGRAVSTIDRLLGSDETLWQAAQADATGIGRAIVGQLDVLGRAEGGAAQAGIDARLGDIAAGLHYQPEALKLAVDIARGTADPEVVQRINAANAVWDRDIAPNLESHLANQEGAGLRRNPTEDQAALANWNAVGQGLPPNALADLARRNELRTARLTGRAEKLTGQSGRLAEAAGVTPGAKGSAATQEAAAGIGAAATGRGALGALRGVQAAARGEGRAAVARTAAERFDEIRQRVPRQVSDQAVQRVVDAADRFRQAQGRLTDTIGQASEATSHAPIVAEVRGLRAEAVTLAERELETLSDMPVDRLPFVPGDLSEYHHAFQSDVGGVDTSLQSEVERLRGNLKGKARPAQEADLWVRAYKRLWKRLPPSLKASLDQLDDAQVRALYERSRAGTLTAMEGGLDQLAGEWLGDRAAGAAEGGVPQFLADFARKARLRAFLAGAKGNVWGPHMLELLHSAVESPDVVSMLEDPNVQVALGSQRLDAAAAELAAGRAEAGAGGAMGGLPDQAEVRSMLADQPIGLTNDQAAALIERQTGGDTLLNEWTAHGGDQVEGSLEKELFRLEEGRPPSWREAEAGAAPPEGLAALRGSEEARSEIGQVLASEGGQSVAGDLGREIGMLRGRAAQGERAAAKGPAAEQRLIGQMTESGAKAGVKAGRQLERYHQSLRALELTKKQIDETPEWLGNELDKLYRDITNNPARTRPALLVARQFTKELTSWRGDLAKQMAEGGGSWLDRELADTLDQAIRSGIKDVRDIYSQHVAGPGGKLEALPTFEAKYRPGGQPLRKREQAAAAGRPQARPLRASLAREEHLKRTPQIPRNADEMRVVLRDRITTHTRNQAARMVAATYGTRAGAIIGDLEDLKGPEIYESMRTAGYEPWNPEALVQRVQPGDVSAATLWLPEPIMRAVENYWGHAGKLEKFMRTYYDKPITFWKAAVLALRPAWHVNNILSNALMAMVGEGIDPITYARRMRQAHALMKLPESQLDVALPEGVVRTGPFSNRRAGRATSPARLEKLRATAGTIEPGTVEALGGLDKLEAPTRLVERGAGASMTQPGELKDLLQSPGRLRRFVNGSYELNGAVDDMNRLAVFLDSRAKLTEADLHNLVAKNPELGQLSREKLRTEGAVRMSLKVAGDFLRMTPLERQVFRRVVPFYVWLRHITQLSLRLPAFSPTRTVWTLHLAQMFGTPGEYGLVSTYPLSGGTLAQLPTINPFGDVGTVDPREYGFNLSPAVKVGAGALFGLDVNRMGQFQRPPGQPGGYGGDPGMHSLLAEGRLGELANLVGGQFPQVRAARGVTDTLTQGEPVMRYPLGQVRRTAKTQGRKPIASGEPVLGPLARYLGLAYERQPNVYEAPENKTRLAKLRQQQKAGSR